MIAPVEILRAERLEMILAVMTGIASVKRGEGKPMDEVFDAIEEELKAKNWPDLQRYPPAQSTLAAEPDEEIDEW